MSASPGQGTLLIDFAEATGTLPTDLELSGTGAVSFSAVAISTACVDPVDWPPELDSCMAPVHVCIVSGKCAVRLAALGQAAAEARRVQGQGAVHLALPFTAQPQGSRRAPRLH